MPSLAESFYAETPLGGVAELPHTGSALENPFVYDVSARELLQFAAAGRLEVIERREALAGGERLVVKLRVRRLA